MRISTPEACGVARSMAPVSQACAAASGSGSWPVIAAARPRSASPSEPPIRPRPAIWTVQSSSALDMLRYRLRAWRALAPDNRRKLAQLRHQRREALRLERLLPIGLREFRLQVHLEDHAIRPGGDRAHRHALDVFPLADRVAGVRDDRQVRDVLENRDRVEVERVARVRLERADTTLAQHDAH